MSRHVLVVLTVTGALCFANACSSDSKKALEGGGSSGASQGGTTGTAGSGGSTGGTGTAGMGAGGTGTGAAADSGTTGGTSGSLDAASTGGTSGNTDAAGTGGSSGSGGGGTGGTSGTADAASTGGTSGSADAASTGGTTGNADAAGSGGSSGSGGAAGTGGTSGSGGAAGTGGATAVGPTPLLQWALDGDGTNTGTVAGYALGLNAVTFVAGKYGQAAQFGVGGYGVVTGSARAVLGSYAQYTISLWVNATSLPASNALFDFINRTTAPYGGIQLSYSSATQFMMCVASTTNNYLGGSCSAFSAPAAAAWHHVILRYAGTGTGAGQGAGVDVYEDDVLVKSVSNDASNNPVFNQAISDTLYIGTGGISLDDVRVYNAVFSVANQCTQIIGGTWTGSSCTMP